MKRTKYIKLFVTATMCIVFSATVEFSYAQLTPLDAEEPPQAVEQQLENLTESGDDEVPEDDSYQQQLVHFIKTPINLNYADEGQLKELKILSPIQIYNLISYRNLLGSFLNIYELQAVPGWDVALIKILRPYITVSNRLNFTSDLKSRFNDGENTILLRSVNVLEKSKGYLNNENSNANFYQGSRQKLLARYKYIYKNLLQYGVTAEKDAGEQFFKGRQGSGFDFYSAHLFIRNLGVIKSLAIGDFSVNLGQGLVQWQALAFKKSSDVLNIKRQSDILRPYNSANEISFNRGAGITLKKNNWETTGFVSYRKIDANFKMDTANLEGYVSSLQTSGYHRTSSEIEDKHIQSQLSFGGNISYTVPTFNVGINAVHYNFGYPITKAPNLYNMYALAGKKFGNYSIDYGYTFKNMHFFGEAAFDENLNKAFVNGLLVNMDANVSMTFLYRNIAKAYQSLYSNAFTESFLPNNESGFYSGISITPFTYLKIDAYADFYHFPWLKYRVNAPSSGNDYVVQITYKPNKQVEIYSRFKTEKKAINYNPFGVPLDPVVPKAKQGLRTQFYFKINSSFTLRSRVELSWFDKKGNDPQNGFLMFTDILYKPLLKPLSGNFRFQYFETDGYDSRLYAYENDVLYGYSIPVFFDKGYRYYLNLNYDINKHFSVWARFAQTIYPEKNQIGSGLDMISGHSKSELKLQAICSF
ncbi:MAG: helix-hairpin-helix domain-containing protein [Ginsengibacter sp.]